MVQSEPFIAEAGSRMFAEKGFHVSHDEFRPFVGMGEDRFLGGVAEARGIPFDHVQDKARTYEIYLELIRGHLQALPGLYDFLAECRRRGLKLAVASSADAIKVTGNLRELGLSRASFDVVVDGSEVAHKKPDPTLFLEASRRLKLDARDCLVVEDAVAGVQAARAVGAHCLGLTTTFGPSELLQAGANWIAPDLAHVPPEVFEGS
jgi:HAD superfamily hydrolase (TIGR01509 family)